jgi:hypothetical protein
MNMSSLGCKLDEALDVWGPGTPQKYSEDRISLAKEILNVLKSRGHWVPTGDVSRWAGSQLIQAVARALDQNKETKFDPIRDVDRQEKQ